MNISKQAIILLCAGSALFGSLVTTLINHSHQQTTADDAFNKKFFSEKVERGPSVGF